MKILLIVLSVLAVLVSTKIRIKYFINSLAVPHIIVLLVFTLNNSAYILLHAFLSKYLDTKSKTLFLKRLNRF